MTVVCNYSCSIEVAMGIVCTFPVWQFVYKNVSVTWVYGSLSGIIMTIFLTHCRLHFSGRGHRFVESQSRLLNQPFLLRNVRAQLVARFIFFKFSILDQDSLLFGIRLLWLSSEQPTGLPSYYLSSLEKGTYRPSTQRLSVLSIL